MTQPDQSVVTQYPELSAALAAFLTALENFAEAAVEAGIIASPDIGDVIGEGGELAGAIISCALSFA